MTTEFESPETTEAPAGMDRRKMLGGMAVGSAAAWVAPAVIGMDVAGAQEASPPPPPPGDCTLRVDKRGPASVFPSQTFDFTIEVFNPCNVDVTNVVVTDTLPTSGTLIGSNPAGNENAGILTVNLGTIPAGASTILTVTWQAPADEALLTNTAVADADNADPAQDTHQVQVTARPVITGSNVVAAGTGLRKRSRGDITIAGIPGDGTVTRAVLVWGTLYGSTLPPNTISLDGNPVVANLEATSSASLCWGDTGTRGFAADVTGLVSGNGTYTITDHPNVTIDDATSDPSPRGFPLTNGASLIVYYESASEPDYQILSDFTYNTSTAGLVVRSFAGITSTGGAADVIIAASDGQSNGGETVRFTGAGVINVNNPQEGSDPILGPSFGIGNLWDTDVFDVASIMPAGQTTLEARIATAGDCIGWSAVVLRVEQ